MRRLKVLAACVAVGVHLLGISRVGAAEVGTTAGSFEVAPTGAATYSIPIVVPPGVSGVEPQLSIGYNSQDGNGLLGLGFSLGGLSAISRCAATLAQDGFIDGVDFDTNDRFCLDGQRLMSVGGSLYRTEIETFTKVKANGTASDPSYFETWTKSGLHMYFGSTPDSRMENQSNTRALAWHVSRIEDVSGNYLTVSYSENRATAETVPTSISYTFNDAMSTGAATEVSFVYDQPARTDIDTGYIGGSLVTASKRLSSIVTKADGATVRTYSLA